MDPNELRDIIGNNASQMNMEFIQDILSGNSQISS